LGKQIVVAWNIGRGIYLGRKEWMAKFMGREFE
jgi:hypothetical protein